MTIKQKARPEPEQMPLITVAWRLAAQIQPSGPTQTGETAHTATADRNLCSSPKENP